MGEIGADRVPDNLMFGVKPRDAGLEPMALQAHKRAQGKADVVALRNGLAVLGVDAPQKM